MDGELTRGKTAFQAVSLIQAAPGADVKVTVRHAPQAVSEPAAAAGSAMAASEEGVTGGGSVSGQDVTLTLRRSSSAKNPVSSR